MSVEIVGVLEQVAIMVKYGRTDLGAGPDGELGLIQ